MSCPGYVSDAIAMNVVVELLGRLYRVEWHNQHPQLSFSIAIIVGDIAKTRRLDAVKLVRQMTGLNLIDSNDLVHDCISLSSHDAEARRLLHLEE